MESQPQNPEFRDKPENFSLYPYFMYASSDGSFEVQDMRRLV